MIAADGTLAFRRQRDAVRTIEYDSNLTQAWESNVRTQ